MAIKGRPNGMLVARDRSVAKFQQLLTSGRELLGRREALRCTLHGSIPRERTT